MTGNMEIVEMVPRGNVEVSLSIRNLDVKVENVITMPFESVHRLIDILLRFHRYSVTLKFRSKSSALDDTFSFDYFPPSGIYANGLAGTAERLRDMADFMERIQREVGIEGSHYFTMGS